jgi:UDP-glucose 4-epimerase
VSKLIREHDVDAIIHFAASLIVPDSVRDPLGYYRNNTVKSRALIACAIETGVRHFIFSSTAAVYGNSATIPVDEETPTLPISPYGWSKLMTEIMLRDASRAHDLRHVTLRYFNVAGADPQGRVGQSSEAATHLIKVAAEAALGLRPKLEVFGTDYPTSDGTCIRDYIHVSDLVGAHLQALRYLRSGGPSLTRIAATATAFRSSKWSTWSNVSRASISGSSTRGGARATPPVSSQPTSACAPLSAGGRALTTFR